MIAFFSFSINYPDLRQAILENCKDGRSFINSPGSPLENEIVQLIDEAIQDSFPEEQ